MNYSVFDAESYFRFLVIYLECAGDFRVVRCLHCDQLVRRGKAGCTPKQTSNTGMSTHMRAKHLGQAAEVLLWIMMFHKHVMSTMSCHVMFTIEAYLRLPLEEHKCLRFV